MYEHILFPTDGSAGGAAAMDHARDIASTYGATVHVLFVADSANQLSHLVAADDASEPSGLIKPDEIEVDSGLVHGQAEGIEDIEAAGERLVAAVAKRFEDDDIDTVTAVREGNPYRSILDYAEHNDIDLLVMPTHGRRGVDRFLLGSVTEKVVRTADVPVLTVRLQAES